jgi:5-aminopentanamidase
VPEGDVVRVAACQVGIDIDAPDRTRAAVVSAVAQAADARAELIVLPELALTGYVFADVAEARQRAEALGGEQVKLFRSLSEHHGVMLVAGWCEASTGEQPYNSVVVVDRGAVLGTYRKTHLWGREKLIFAPGDRFPPVLDTRCGRIAPMICYDLEFPEMVRAAGLAGAEVVVASSNWPRGPLPAGERPVEVAKAQAGAAANRLAVVVADRCRTERGQEWFGASLICGPDGYLRAGPAAAQEVVLVADIDLAECRDKSAGPYNDVLADRRPELYVDGGGAGMWTA